MNQKEMKEVSEIAANVYDSGCYMLSLLRALLGREPTLEEIVTNYKDFVKKGFMDKDCYMKQPLEIVKMLTGRNWRMTKSDTLDKTADIIIGYWYNPKTNYHHFVLMNKANKVVWDSLVDSNTVKNGKIESYRLFWKI